MSTFWMNSLSSFIKYPQMWPQCTQWVFCKVLTMNSQFGPILPQTLKELIGYMVEYIVITFVGTLWKNSGSSFKKHSLGILVGKLWTNLEWTPWVCLNHISGYIAKEIRGFIQDVFTGHLLGILWKNSESTFEKYPLGILVGTFWMNPEWTPWIWLNHIGGYFLNEPRTNPLGLFKSHQWVLFKRTHHLPTGFVVGKLFQNPQWTHNVPAGYMPLRPQC